MRVICEKCGWEGVETREYVHHEGCPSCYPELGILKPAPPKRGYDLPLWEQAGQYRATALAYMKRENVAEIQNSNGCTYTLKEIEQQTTGYTRP